MTTYPFYNPDDAPSPLSHLTEQPYFFVTKHGGSNITGYRMLLSPRPSSDGRVVFGTEELWRVGIPAESERIVSVQGKRASGECDLRAYIDCLTRDIFRQKY